LDFLTGDKMEAVAYGQQAHRYNNELWAVGGEGWCRGILAKQDMRDREENNREMMREWCSDAVLLLCGATAIFSTTRQYFISVATTATRRFYFSCQILSRLCLPFFRFFPFFA
jgi:hypothetical protein